MANKDGIWRFSGVLRVVALVMAAIYILLYVTMWGYLIFGDTELVFYYIDIESAAPLKFWQTVLAIGITSVEMGAYVIICLAANRFLKASKSAGFFIEEVIKACRQIGWGIILYWLGTIWIDYILPGVLTFYFPEGERVAIDWIAFDHYVLVLVGVILLLMAQALKEAREIDSDNKQII